MEFLLTPPRETTFQGQELRVLRDPTLRPAPQDAPPTREEDLARVSRLPSPYPLLSLSLRGERRYSLLARFLTGLAPSWHAWGWLVNCAPRAALPPPHLLEPDRPGGCRTGFEPCGPFSMDFRRYGARRGRVRAMPGARAGLCAVLRRRWRGRCAGGVATGARRRDVCADPGHVPSMVQRLPLGAGPGGVCPRARPVAGVGGERRGRAQPWLLPGGGEQGSWRGCRRARCWARSAPTR